MWPFLKTEEPQRDFVSPCAPDPLQAAVEARRHAAAELAEATFEKQAMRVKYSIFVDRLEQILSAKVQAANRAWLDREWRAACQKVGRCLKIFSECLAREAEAKKARQ